VSQRTQRLRHLVRRLRGLRSVESLVMELTPERPSIGRMLLSYHPEVFERLLEGDSFDEGHITDWHGFQIARTFLDLGFEVDVIHFLNEEFIPHAQYDVLVDVMVNLGRLSHHLPNSKKFLHPHGAHWTVNNARTYARHAALAERRGVSLFPERVFVPNDSVERADLITCRGGEWGHNTFAFTSTPIVDVPQVTPAAINEFIDRDIERCRRRFVWVGGRGMVHKGVDLLLEAFAALPDCHLTVCGNVVKEPLFEEAYRHELWNLPNVTTLGFVDTASSARRPLNSAAAA
jgi:glycosyltransferase involved in cell wall biosynthesis